MRCKICKNVVRHANIATRTRGICGNCLRSTKKLINTIIDWCKEQPSISWIDLGVFSGNDVAKIVFEKNGFKELGYKEDAWLVDGNSIGETSMTISVNN